ncbi:hypothetical protein EVAR_29814_1 [Eumeta japonica]|uniref:Uncharacterized protein n=1 Tax=Eumeta variegata TaxID=151549 RepID=A0A4C1XPR8_EUMVA|nr:hypothetical protein EVAR_29814_1 [Eumeta japonica]
MPPTVLFGCGALSLPRSAPSIAFDIYGTRDAVDGPSRRPLPNVSVRGHAEARARADKQRRDGAVVMEMRCPRYISRRRQLRESVRTTPFVVVHFVLPFSCCVSAGVLAVAGLPARVLRDGSELKSARPAPAANDRRHRHDHDQATTRRNEEVACSPRHDARDVDLILGHSIEGSSVSLLVGIEAVTFRFEVNALSIAEPTPPRPVPDAYTRTLFTIQIYIGNALRHLSDVRSERTINSEVINRRKLYIARGWTRRAAAVTSVVACRNPL